MTTPSNKVLELLAEHITDVKKVVDINQKTGTPRCPLCKKDLGLSKDAYVVCKNSNCEFFGDFWSLFKFLNELVDNMKK